MDPVWLIVIVMIVAAVAAGIWWFVIRHDRRRTDRLKRKFGPEYEHTVATLGNRRRAEVELERRERRVTGLRIRPLDGEERERFASAWRLCQGRFVDDPKSAVAEADILVCEVMRAKGYPMGDFENRAGDLSVDHPAVVRNYRRAHEVAVKQERNDASTEDLRIALVCYRDLFDDLLETKVLMREEVPHGRTIR